MYGGYGCFSLKIAPGWLQPHPFLQDLPIPGQHPSLFCCPWLQTRIISWWQWLLLWLAGSFLSTPMCFLFFCAFSFRCPCKSVSTPEGIFLKPYFLNSEVSNTISFLQILGGGKSVYISLPLRTIFSLMDTAVLHLRVCHRARKLEPGAG